jgi:hypothetical protein
MRMMALNANRTRILVLCFGTSAWLLGGCNTTGAPPPATQQAIPRAATMTPVVSVNAIMVGFVDHAAHVLWDVADETKAPKTDRDWGELEHHAIQTAAAGTLIGLGGTGPADPGWALLPEWKTYSQQLSDGGLAALNAVRRKDRAAILKAGDQIVQTCEGCHEKFKPDLPTEGIVHPHYQ